MDGSWKEVTKALTVTGVGGVPWPGRVVYRGNEEGFTDVLIDVASSARTEQESFDHDPRYPSLKAALGFYTLGTYRVQFDAAVTHRTRDADSDGNRDVFTASGLYTFHVGPVAELELQAAWDAPGVFTLTAVNHGPDNAPAAQVTVTPPPGLRFVRGEASRGTYHDNGVNAVWHIGGLESTEYRRLLGSPENETLTIYTEPAGAVTQTVNANTQDQEITASIENTDDYCVRIKTGTRVDPATIFDDLECRGDLPSSYTEHSAGYYDHRPDNNKVTLPADWTAVPVADTRLTGIAITSDGGYQAGDDIEITATFNKAVTVVGQPRLRLRVGEITREAALHSHSGNSIVFRYRVQEGDSDSVDGVSIPPGPFVLPPGSAVVGPGGGRVSLFFAGLADDPAHRVYPTVDRVAGTDILVWSPPENLYTGVEGARYRLFERVRHYYRYNDLTRRWEIEFRIADANLDAPDQNLIQWLYLRTGGYYLTEPHIYGAAPVEMKPWLGAWAGGSERRQQICTGFKAEFSPGKTRGQRLEELKDVEIHRFSYKAYSDGEYEVSQTENVENSLGTARSITSGTTCPDPPTGEVTIQGQAATRGPLEAVLSDPNGVDRDSVNWQWKRSPDGTTQQNVGYTGFSDITGATGSSYDPGDEDAGRWLRVKATYTDGQASTRSAWGQSAGPVPGAAQQQQPPAAVADIAPQSVAADWPLIPTGLGAGDSFRLLFVTSTTTTADSSDIADYNEFVQARAAANTNLAGFSGRFRALVSTAGVNVKDNSATAGTGVPVHWLGGEKVADDYADLYDLSWDSVEGRTEGGGSYTSLVWTGGNGRGETSQRSYAGAAQVRMGDLGDATRPLSSPTVRAATESHPLYALSPVITVVDPNADRPGVVSLDMETLQAGSPLRAVLLDPDVVVAGSIAWQWQRSPIGTTAQDVVAASFEDIAGATGETYTPVEGDVGRWLRARAVYTDGHGPGKTAMAQAVGPVVGQVRGAPPDQQQQTAVITALGMHSSGPYGDGDAISVAVAFSRDVAVAGAPTLSIEVGGQRRTATYAAAASAAAVKVFSYTVREGDQDGDGVSVYPGSITLPEGASITDSGGSDADLTLAGLAPQPGHTVDASVPPPPSVTGLEMHSAGPYAAGEAIEVVAHFSEPVTVAGTPSLQLQVGGRSRAALYTAEGGDNDSKVFRYTVREEDRDEDGVSVAAGSIALPEGASIRNAGGIDAALAHAGLPAQAGHTVGAQQQQQAANNEPQFALASDARSVDENAATGSNVGAAITASDADSDELTYALTGSGAFAIDASTGQITVQGALDYETQSSYALTVSVSDGKDASGRVDTSVDDTIAITVSVGNVDEAGIVSFNTDPPRAGNPLTASLNDPDGGVSGETWDWEASADGTNWTAIGGASEASYTPSDDDVGSYLRAMAGYADGHGPGKSAVATTASAVEAAPAPTPTPEPEPPTVIAGPVIVSSPASGDTYGEGQAILVAVTFSEAVTASGDVRVRLTVGERQRWARYDHSRQDGTVLAFAYLVKGSDRDDNGVSIGANQLQLRGGTVTDGDGDAASLEHSALADQSGHKVDGSLEQQPAQQQQAAANNEPEFALDSDARSVDENAATGSNVGGPVTATDADGDELTYALTGSGAFAIDAGTGQITVSGALDFETHSSYGLTVAVSDGKDASGGADSSADDTIAITVSVGNVDEAGRVSFDADPPRAGSPLTASLDDPDKGVSGATWTWESSSDGTNWSAIDGASGASYTPSDDDVGSYLRATASYGDGHGPGKSALAATASAVAAAPAAQQQQTPTVPADSPLVPTGLGPGDSFRLLFVTSTSMKAESADVADYNKFVQTRAAANTNLASFSSHFTAYISTATVDARDNTGATGTGVPVHWLGGDKVADDYADLHDGDWDSVSGKTEGGSSYTGLVWTGGNKQGGKSGQRHAGAAEVRMGDLGAARLPLSSPTARAATESHPLYALSPVITVAQPE